MRLTGARCLGDPEVLKPPFWTIWAHLWANEAGLLSAPGLKGALEGLQGVRQSGFMVFVSKAGAMEWN